MPQNTPFCFNLLGCKLITMIPGVTPFEKGFFWLMLKNLCILRMQKIQNGILKNVVLLSLIKMELQSLMKSDRNFLSTYAAPSITQSCSYSLTWHRTIFYLFPSINPYFWPITSEKSSDMFMYTLHMNNFNLKIESLISTTIQ